MAKWREFPTRDETIAALEAENAELRMQCFAHGTQACEAYEAQQRAEAKLAMAVEALGECEAEIDTYIIHQYPSNHPVAEQRKKRGFSTNPARIALAELKGGDE